MRSAREGPDKWESKGERLVKIKGLTTGMIMATRCLQAGRGEGQKKGLTNDWEKKGENDHTGNGPGGGNGVSNKGGGSRTMSQ